MVKHSRPLPRKLRVIGKRNITPNMLRVTLGGAGMAGYPASQEGGYVKLRLSPENNGGRPIVRTYTIRQQRKDELDIDFALHGLESGGAGPATRWAAQVEPGESIDVGGPGPAKPMLSSADWHLVAGDMTALPAISVHLANLPSSAKGDVVLSVRSDEDRQVLERPPGVNIHWLVELRAGSAPEYLADRVRDLGWRAGFVSAWVACEFSSMRLLREYLYAERKLSPSQQYISSYWKAGLNEDAHKQVKREDATGFNI